MQNPSTPTWSIARIVSLVLIGLAVAGLVTLRFGSGDESVTVPQGAAAGDLSMEPCDYPGETGPIPAECGTLIVPETRDSSASTLIALPVTRIPAASDGPKEPIFFLTGGPGQSNLGFEAARRYTDDRDFVLVGYRGIDGSVRLDCPEVESAFRHATNLLGQRFFRALADAHRSCADRLGGEGIDVASYGLVQQIEDMEAARVAFGYQRINLLSESAGTRTALIYSWRYPDSVHRSVMVAVNPPGAFLWEAEMTDAQVDRYAALCAADGVCRARTDDLAETIRRTASDIPRRWGVLPIKEANVLVFSMFGLFEPTPEGSAFPAPMTLEAWLSASEGDPSGLWFSSVLADVMLPELFVRGQYASAAMLDAQAARDYFAQGLGDISNLGRAATAAGWAGGLLPDAWPAAADEAEYSEVRTSHVETLLIGGELDVSTPPQVSTRELLPYLPNGQEIVLPGFGHTGTFFGAQPEAGSRLVNTFFDSGQVDDSLYVPQGVDFTPARTLGAAARIALGAILGMIALTAISLLALAHRVRTRGRLGSASAAVLRSVYLPVLGLGGWLLGALLVLTTMPAVRVDNQLLVVLFGGVPIGLGIYLAWVGRSWPERTRAVGLTMAMTGSLVGAWLGFNAIGRPLAPVTAVIGAAVAGNLAVILFDVYREGRRRHHRPLQADEPAGQPVGV